MCAHIFRKIYMIVSNYPMSLISKFCQDLCFQFLRSIGRERSSSPVLLTCVQWAQVTCYSSLVLLAMRKHWEGTRENKTSKYHSARVETFLPSKKKRTIQEFREIWSCLSFLWPGPPLPPFHPSSTLLWQDAVMELLPPLPLQGVAMIDVCNTAMKIYGKDFWT